MSPAPSLPCCRNDPLSSRTGANPFKEEETQRACAWSSVTGETRTGRPAAFPKANRVLRVTPAKIRPSSGGGQQLSLHLRKNIALVGLHQLPFGVHPEKLVHAARGCAPLPVASTAVLGLGQLQVQFARRDRGQCQRSKPAFLIPRRHPNQLQLLPELNPQYPQAGAVRRCIEQALPQSL